MKSPEPNDPPAPEQPSTQRGAAAHPAVSQNPHLPPAASPSDPSAAKTLLVVDDEEALRDLMVLVLGSGGFHVLQAASVADALRIASQPAPIHMLLTDFSLPDGNGFDLARRFRSFHPQTPILLVSGSVAGMDPQAEGLDRFTLVEKPFEFSDLLRLVRTTLATP